ncbi:CRISPR-associated protein Cas4 [Chakrabartyella piscis]|uniref:CRISPR-associated protein Cas4 n=1 Tax=Chakrabartyella piscis TaxID=2918914 RepID=UPI0029587908|nr:CRISPR-associated protein Cas4 [Chakrabartyella piscis]
MESINIRDLQHFLYCPHRWGLIHIDKIWVENLFVIKANLMHEKVHDREKVVYGKEQKTLHAVTIFNDDLGLFGVTDSLILEKGKYILMEYKPTQPKGKSFNREDALQVFAQKVCVDKIFGTDTKCYLYYKNQKAKVLLPFREEYDAYYQMLEDTLSEIRGYIEQNQIPPIQKGQKCSGCSFKDICMPTKRKKANIRKVLQDILEGGI